MRKYTKYSDLEEKVEKRPQDIELLQKKYRLGKYKIWNLWGFLNKYGG